MARTVKLVMVSSENNNKYYDMVDNGNGTFTATWGRVGATKSTQNYPIGKWDSQYKSKLRKGYVDNTELFVVEGSSVEFEEISDDVVSRIVARLQAYANHSIAENYTVSSEAVTQKHIDRAQQILDDLVPLIAVRNGTEKINTLLLDLYKVIPRRMSKVNLHLLNFEKISKDNIEEANRLLSNNQDILDVMRGQVQVNQAQKDNTVEDKKTILDAMGIDITTTLPTDVNDIKRLLGEISGQYHASYRVTNRKTQEKFDRYVAAATNKKRENFWHGSRNENWWSIIDTGLVLRPTNAVISGKMFGYGIYFADKARKSLGYTSMRGSRWAGGSQDTAFMSLYDVHLGETLDILHHQQWCYELTEAKLKARGNYDAVFAKGGANLFNNEYIVYNDNKCTIKYLVELKG